MEKSRETEEKSSEKSTSSDVEDSLFQGMHIMIVEKGMGKAQTGILKKQVESQGFALLDSLKFRGIC